MEGAMVTTRDGSWPRLLLLARTTVSRGQEVPIGVTPVLTAMLADPTTRVRLAVPPAAWAAGRPIAATGNANISSAPNRASAHGKGMSARIGVLRMSGKGVATASPEFHLAALSTSDYFAHNSLFTNNDIFRILTIQLSGGVDASGLAGHDSRPPAARLRRAARTARRARTASSCHRPAGPADRPRGRSSRYPGSTPLARTRSRRHGTAGTGGEAVHRHRAPLSSPQRTGPVSRDRAGFGARRGRLVHWGIFLTGARTRVGGLRLSLRGGRIRCRLGRPSRRGQPARQDGSHRARPVVPPRWPGPR
jgi:hypothetical protein